MTWFPLNMCCLLQGHHSDAGESAAGTAMNTIPNPNLLAKTLLIVSTTSLARQPMICAHILLLAHHSCIATGFHKDVIWRVRLQTSSIHVMLARTSFDHDLMAEHGR